MVLKFSDKPQIIYGSNYQTDVWQRFPAGAHPIATAPERSASPVIVHEANGQSHWALHHNGAWRKLSPFKDWRTGTVNWRMDGTEIPNAVAWSMPKRK